MGKGLRSRCLCPTKGTGAWLQALQNAGWVLSFAQQ